MKDSYQLLNVSPGASPEEVKKAYRVLVKRYHPDRFTDEKEKLAAEDIMKEINVAFEQIMASKTPLPKQEYDTSYTSQEEFIYDQDDPIYQYYRVYFSFDFYTKYRHDGRVFVKIEKLISEDKLPEAEELLTHTGETAGKYLCMTLICMKKQEYDSAYENIREAYYFNNEQKAFQLDSQRMIDLIHEIDELYPERAESDRERFAEIEKMIDQSQLYRAGEFIRMYCKSHGQYYSGMIYYLWAKLDYAEKRYYDAENDVKTAKQCYHPQLNDKLDALLKQINYVQIRKIKLISIPLIIAAILLIPIWLPAAMILMVRDAVRETNRSRSSQKTKKAGQEETEQQPPDACKSNPDCPV